MKAVILAGGLGTRLAEETERIPKPMVSIGDRPIIWHIMKIYSHHGINDFIICVGYRGYVIKEFFLNYFLHLSDVTVDIKNNRVDIHKNEAEPWRVTIVDTGMQTMTGGRLKRIASYVEDETFCLTYGDGLSDVDVGRLVDFHRGHGRLATVTAITPPGRFGALDTAGSAVTRIREKPADSQSLINGGFFVLEPQVFDYVEGDDTVWEQEPLQALSERGELQAYVHRGFWQPMDTLREKQVLEELWRSGRAPWRVW